MGPHSPVTGRSLGRQTVGISKVCHEAVELCLRAGARARWVKVDRCRESCGYRCSKQDGTLAPEDQMSWEAGLQED